MSVAAAYIDTSAFLRLFIDEGDSDETWEIVRGMLRLFASRLVLTEARVTLARMRRGNRLSEEDYHTALQSVLAFWDDEVVCCPLTEDVHRAADGLAPELALRSADALHLGAALEIRRTLPDDLPFGFIAFDHDLLKAAAALRFTPLPSPGTPVFSRCHGFGT
ncbi:MAG: type II toxin-antitoxin system VapC family toxin [Acidobacteria bacterium]|nr:type II toxin-antitoxin system VapC family toxin [Acidobacteriota bacterium]